MDSRAWDERYAAEPLVWSAGPNRFVEEALRDRAPGRALDLACGEGRNAIWLASRGWRVTGVDFSAVALEKARSLAERQGLDIEWVVGDVLAEPLPPSDLVLLAYLQLPREERRAVVRRAVGTLRAGGTFFLVAHDSTNLTAGTGGPQDPTVLYTAEDVVADLGERLATVEIVRAERVARPVPAGTGEGGGHSDQPGRIAWDAIVELRRR